MKNDICAVEGCEKLVRSGNVCQGHNWRMKVHGSYDKPSRKKFGNKCKAEGCENDRDRKQRSSLCTMHRVRMSRHKSIDLPIKNLPEGIAKICIHHGALTIKDTYPVPGKNWLQCKLCKIVRSENYRDANPDRILTKNYIFLGKKENRIKVSIKDYEKMHENQKGLCAICNKPETMRSPHSKNDTKRLAIDHNHITMKTRGLLCHHCNTGIGHFKDSIELLQSAIHYIKSNS